MVINILLLQPITNFHSPSGLLMIKNPELLLLQTLPCTGINIMLICGLNAMLLQRSPKGTGFAHSVVVLFTSQKIVPSAPFMQANNLLNHLISEEPSTLSVETSTHHTAPVLPVNTFTFAPSVKATTQPISTRGSLEINQLKTRVHLPHYDCLFLSVNWLTTLKKALCASY